MYLGIQWLEYNTASRRVQRANYPFWFPTPVTNAIKPRANAMVSRLLRSRPQGRVRPQSNEIQDRQAAEVGERLISHIYDVSDELLYRQRAASYAVLTGTVVAEDYFNPRAGMQRIIPRTETQETPVTRTGAVCPNHGVQGGEELVGGACALCGSVMQAGTGPHLLPNGEQAVEVEQVPVLDPETMQPVFDTVCDGELETRMLMLFNFYWDPKAQSLREAQWCGEMAYVDLDWIDRNFPEMGPYVAAESGIDAANFYEASLLSLVGPSQQGSAHYGGQMSYQNGAVLRKYQEKPSAKHPAGRHVLTANGVLLYKGGLPIKDKEGSPTGDFSYTEFRYDFVPGRFSGASPVDDMVPLQRRINGIDAQIILNRKTLLNPWVLAPKGSGLNPGQNHMRPGATVLYNFVGVGAAPQVVPGTPLPEQVFTEQQKCLDAMDALAEDPRVASMQMPQNTRSGVALHWQKEQLDEYGISRLERWGQWIAERDRKRLLLAQQHYREERVIRKLGESSYWEIRLFKGADLAGNTDVVVAPGSLIPRSRSAQTQVVFDAIEAGIIDLTNPIDRQKVIEELQLGRFESDVGPDRRKAMMENAAMDEGVQPQVAPEDNHDIHALEHLMQIKDPGFNMKLPEVQISYRRHLAAHHQMKAQLIGEQQVGAPPAAGQVPFVEETVEQPMNGAGAVSSEGAEGTAPPM